MIIHVTNSQTQGLLSDLTVTRIPLDKIVPAFICLKHGARDNDTVIRKLLDCIFNTELLGFWTLSIVRILIVTRKKNKHDVSETGSVSVLK
jgi:hypothetical protein